MMASEFVEKSLGPWSSHPVNLRKQRLLLLFLGLIPIVAVIVLSVLVWRDMFSSFFTQIGLFACTLFFTFGFLVTLAVLYLACFTVGSKKGKITHKDELLLPPWLWGVFCVFWLLPYLLSILPDSFLDFNSNLNLRNIKIILNMLSISPFLCILTWILCAKEEELKENEKLVRRPYMLILALACIGALVASFFIPKYRLCVWIVSLPLFLIFLALWYFWRKKVVAGEQENPQEEEKETEEKEKPKMPEQAAYIVSKLPDGIWYEGDGKEQQLAEFSPHIPEDESAFPLIALMNGKVPTADQAEFLDKFISLYEKTLNNFFENAKPNSDQILPDLILQGPEGSGRTEALCAAAVYAAAVRGQNVLYIVQESSYASVLAEKMKARFQELFIDCYYTTDYLKPNFVEVWLPSGETEDEKKDHPNGNTVRELPPNILFATPEQIEGSFFNNGNLTSEEKRNALRNIMLSYSVIMADDFLEMPTSVQAHLAFIFDKFRLLQASEYVMGQFVIATAPLYEPYGVDGLAERLFGLSFNTTKNAVVLRPRQCEPFWCGTLRISPDFAGDQSLEKAARALLDISTEKKYNTLFYSKGISRQEAEELESDYEKKGSVSVSSRLYQLNVEKMPFDTIFYLSLTSGNAAAALRLSLPDDKAGTPVFFRIALEKEAEEPIMDQFALLPNETAISLRAYHLRSVLPFLPQLTPIPASVWSHFGISLTHPYCRDAEIAKMPEGLAVSWYYDYYTEQNRYGENVIWPYLVLSSNSTISNVGQKINFDVLPSTKDSIWRDKHLADTKGDALFFVSGERKQTDSKVFSQMAVWRDARGNTIGTTDLAHADLLTLITADNHFSVREIQSVDKREQDALRYAMVLTAQPRRGLAHDIPVRRFSWNLPEGGFSLPDLYQGEFSSFSVRFGETFTNSVSAEINGLMNSAGIVAAIGDSKGKYAYDAFMSGIVFLPEKHPEAAICKSLSGKWTTEASSGFSSPLTHAFSIALRNRMAGLSFFAMTPVFLIEGRDGSFGRLLLWLLEPYNSGSTVYPLLAQKLFREDLRFKTDLLTDIQKILVTEKNEYITLEEIRCQSRMAFTGEDDLSPEQWQKEIEIGLHVVQLLLDSKALKEDLAVRAEKRRQQEQRRAEEQKKRQAEIIDPSLIPEEERKQYQEFSSVATTALMNFEESIDVSRFCRDYGWSPEKVGEVFDDFLWNSPEIFFVAKSYHTHYQSETDGRIISFFITNLHYSFRKEEYEEKKRILDQEVAKAMKLLNGITDPVKKALLLHDHIVRVCEYDVEARDKQDPSPLARTVYSVLVRHLAVCEGYTMAYRYLLNRAGIRSEEILSDKMNHCWNYLCLNGKWYHVDVTWDDPIYCGRKPDNEVISHDYFLLSDAKISTKEHHDWSTRGLPSASDTSFDEQNWDTY